MYAYQPTPNLPAAPPTFIPTSGMGLFDGGVFNFSSYGLTEWLIVGGGLFLALGGTKLLTGRRGASAGRRKSLALAKARYELARAQA